MNPPARMYVIVDNTLSAGAKAAQGGHALVDFVMKYPSTAKFWHENGNVLIILETDAVKLHILRSVFVTEGLRFASFREPDFNNALTAVAVFGTVDAQSHLKGLPLAKDRGWFGERRSRQAENDMRQNNR